MRTFSTKVAFIHWTHQNLVRIFGMFAFNALCEGSHKALNLRKSLLSVEFIT